MREVQHVIPEAAGHERENSIYEKYDRLEVLGNGVYGTVYRAKDNETGDIVAIKRLHLDEESEDGIPPHIIREISLLRDFQHNNILRLLGIQCPDALGSPEFELIFEYLDTDLNKILKAHRCRNEHMPLDMVMKYSHQLLSGIHACHTRLIIHRDLKPENLLIGKDGLKIGDFGLSRFFSLPFKPYTHDVITLWYRSPEILLGCARYGPEVDMWSGGCIVAEMATSYPLFPGDSEIGTIFKILQLLGTPSEDTWPGLSHLEYWMSEFPRWPPTELMPIFEARPEITDAGLELLRGLLSLNPQARLTARKAKNATIFHEYNRA